MPWADYGQSNTVILWMPRGQHKVLIEWWILKGTSSPDKR